MAKKLIAQKKIFLTSNPASSRSVWAERRDIPLTILGWIAVIIIFFWLFGHIGHSILLLVIAAFLAYALVPAVRFFERFMPRFAAILLVYIVVLTGLGVVIYFLISTAVEQFRLLSHSISYLLTPKGNASSPLVLTLQKFGISHVQITQASGQLTQQAEHLTSSIVPFLRSIFALMLDMLLIAVLSIYLLVDGTQMIRWMRNNTPATQQTRIIFLFDTFERIVGGYIRGQITLAAIIGLLIGIGMAVLHVPYAILLGVLAFILEFIPILGTLVSGAICVMLALTQGWLIALLVLGYFMIMHVVEGDILGPRIVGKALGLHPLVSIIALIAGSEVYGIVGALFASPVAGVIQAVLVTSWAEWKATHPGAFLKEEKQLTKSIEKNIANKPIEKQKKFDLLKK